VVYAPGHFKEISQPRARGRRERIAVRLGGLIAVILAGLVIYSLTDHQRQSAHGCIDFTYSTMIGGAERYECGAQARTDCLSRPSNGGIDGDFQPELYIACRKAGLPIG
jgi:hypothetical protein